MQIRFLGMMNQYYCIQVNNTCYYYQYEGGTAKTFREDTENGMGKVVARTYKSFRDNVLKIQGGSARANLLQTELMKASTFNK